MWPEHIKRMTYESFTLVLKLTELPAGPSLSTRSLGTFQMVRILSLIHPAHQLHSLPCFTNQLKHSYQIVCQPEDRANPSTWAKLQARVNWGLNLAHLCDCRVLRSRGVYRCEKGEWGAQMRRRGAGPAGSSVTIVREQSDIKSYQPFTSYPPVSNFFVLSLLLCILIRWTSAEHLQ